MRISKHFRTFFGGVSFFSSQAENIRFLQCLPLGLLAPGVLGRDVQVQDERCATGIVEIDAESHLTNAAHGRQRRRCEVAKMRIARDCSLERQVGFQLVQVIILSSCTPNTQERCCERIGKVLGRRELRELASDPGIHFCHSGPEKTGRGCGCLAAGTLLFGARNLTALGL